MVVLDEFSLFIAHVLGNDTIAAERDPLNECVESLALGGGGIK
jgi:hypothetical protein